MRRLVGHSYGGMVITELADHPRVRHSVYLAAFLPSTGESIMDLRSEHTVEWVVPAPAGAAPRVTGDPEVARRVMAAGADRVHRLDAGHMVMLSRPTDVAELLLAV